METEKENKNSINLKKICIICILMILAFLVTISPLYITALVDKSSSRLEAIASMSQVVTNAFVVFGVIVALWQYIIYSRRELEQKDKELYDVDKAKVQKAIDLAYFFKNEVINKFTKIYYIYDECGIVKILDEIDKNKQIKFEYNELKSLLSKEQLKILKEINGTEKFKKALTDHYKNLDPSNIATCFLGSDNKAVKFIPALSVLSSQFNSLLNDVLNNLEYFSMHFIHNTADESVIYQSVHNSYITIVRCFYYDICMNNDGSAEEKLYTKTIELFNQWNEVAKVQSMGEYAATSEFVRKGKKL